jgi:hypothetical protein
LQLLNAGVWQAQEKAVINKAGGLVLRMNRVSGKGTGAAELMKLFKSSQNEILA